MLRKTKFTISESNLKPMVHNNIDDDNLVVKEDNIWKPCKIVGKIKGCSKSYKIKLQSVIVVRRTSYHLYHITSQRFNEFYVDDDDILLGHDNDENSVGKSEVNEKNDDAD
ncbi:Hypothetical protein CINCED_3A021372 [Cinara cedri]|uniref:Uncharacterized protein n=1 Tax=Cinara cedri TaxID=506608 RepID=A0A5E4N418_9HEMI|nr:Hypothetical protein CINCED_3A021372 [Cinara cedri]